METVSIQKAHSYERQTVEAAIARLLEPFGGIVAFVRKGERVLIKPNMLSAKPPEAAVTTHPEVVRAVVRLVQSAGALPLIGDSPGIGGFFRVAERTGLADIARETGTELVEFDEVREVPSGGLFRRFQLSGAYLDADRVINLPKLKTHEMMTLTCAVKNLFGVVVGAGKAGWHLKAGADREIFARMLVEISRVRVPELTIVDGIVAMEGNGPGSGDPRPLGVLLAGTNPVAVDVIAGEITGIPQHLLYTQRAARDAGIAGSDRESVMTVGISVDEVRVTDFRLPHLSDVQFGLPRFLKNRLRHHFTPQIFATDRCRKCGICLAACPPQAISLQKDKLRFEHQKCIHCFCCRELCPENALALKEGLVLRLSRKLSLIKINP